MLRIVPHTVPRVGRSYEHFPDGFELHLLHAGAGELETGAAIGPERRRPLGPQLLDARASSR